MTAPSAMQVILGLRKTGLLALTGTTEFASLGGFLQGVAYGLKLAHLRDERFQQFLAWLRKRGQAPSPGGWLKYFHELCGGDDEAALWRFVEAAEEFERSVPATQS